MTTDWSNLRCTECDANPGAWPFCTHDAYVTFVCCSLHDVETPCGLVDRCCDACPAFPAAVSLGRPQHPTEPAGEVP